MLTDNKKNTAPVIEVHVPELAVSHQILLTTSDQYKLVRTDVFEALERQLNASADLYDSTADMATYALSEHDGMLVTTLYQAAENARYLVRYLKK